MPSASNTDFFFFKPGQLKKEKKTAHKHKVKKKKWSFDHQQQQQQQHSGCYRHVFGTFGIFRGISSVENATARVSRRSLS